jgi:GNAT superfamily N-acetyltransferase
MTGPELTELVDWAALEGWNPGLHDAELFWRADPDAFIAAELDGELIGGGSIASYDGRFGFMGFFIVRPEFRGLGFGNTLWQARKRLLEERLRPGAAIGMDGVFEMQDWYARAGFRFSHREVRFRGIGSKPEPGGSLVTLAEVPFEQLLNYDSGCFPAPRERFLRAWVTQSESLALASLDDGELAGYGVIRRCREGAKIGPLFADDAATAAKLYDGLAGHSVGDPVFLDIPEVNPEAIAWAASRGMQPVFGCARMYAGPAPDLPATRIFGVTSFEFG